MCNHTETRNFPVRIAVHGLLVLLFFVLSGLATAGAVPSEQPDPNFPYVNGYVSAIAINHDLGIIFIGGGFTEVDGVPRKHLAAIDTDGNLLPWNPGLDPDIDYAYVNVIAVSPTGDSVYVGGPFTQVGDVFRNGLARISFDLSGDSTVMDWDPNPNTGVGSISSIAVDGATVYVSGGFSEIAGTHRHYLAAIDTDGNLLPWLTDDDFYGFDGAAASMVVDGSTVYLGGSFQQMKSVTRRNLAASGTDGTLLPWNLDANGGVGVLALGGATVYVAGKFSEIGGVARSRLAAISKGGSLQEWSPNANHDVFDIAVDGSIVYVGGDFSEIDGTDRFKLAAIGTDGTLLPWNPNGDSRFNIDGAIWAMAVHDEYVYVGGNFSKISGEWRGSLVRFGPDPEPELTLSPGGGNPDTYATFYGIAGQFDYDNGATDVPIIQITLTANEVDDWLVTGLIFQTEGTGNEKEDVAEARLYLGSVGGKLLGTKTFTADNGGIDFSFNEEIPKNESRDFMLVYDVKPERAWPCNDYKAFIDISGVGATPVTFPSGVKLPPQDEQVDGGPSTVKMGDLWFVDGDRQYGEAESPEAENNPLEKPLKVRLAWQHPASVNHVTYGIISPQANGGFLAGVPGTRDVEKQVDAEGYAEETLTLGTKKGKQNPYEVQMGMDMKGGTCYSSWAPPVFMAWGMGLDMAAESQYDNPDNGELFGTFLSNVQADNSFTLTIDMAPEDYAEVQEVLFAMGGQTQTGEEKTKNKEYTAEFDMQSFEAPQKLLITVVMLKDGSTVEQKAEYDVKAIKLPSWVDAVYKISHEESFTREFSEEDGGTYNFAFNYPTNFAWSDVVPGDIGMLGGLDNDLDIEFTAEAAYRVNETSTFGATVSGEPTILGRSFSLEGGLSGDFDPDFAFQRGNGSLRAGFEFDLPKKGYAKTILVYGVPITVAVDLSGNVEIFVQGSAVLNRELEFERITVAPGTTVTGHITISLSAVFGLAKLAATGSPTATVEIELTYTTESGTETTWQGEVSVPISVVGSIFWGMGSAELYSGELGPWQFGSGGRAPAAFRPLGDVSGLDAPDFISASALAIDPAGRQMQVWTADTGKSESPDPDVFYRFYDTTAWSDSAPIIGAQNSPDQFWETDPAVVFMKTGTALAAWTSNKGDKSLDTLWDILSHQDIAYALWNGATWSTPALLTDDLKPDGVVDLTYDAGNDAVMAVWVHDSHDHGQDGVNGNNDGKMTRTGWTLKYGIFHNDVWSLPDQVPDTGDGSADFMPSVAADGNGAVLLVWARDGDGEFFTKLDTVQGGTNVDSDNTDSDIYWSRWNGTEWQTPAPLTETNAATALFPTVAFGSGGRAVAVWVEKSGTLEKLMYRIYENAAWKDTGMVHESTLPVEEPAVAIDGNGRITLVWRGHANGRSNLFMSRADIDTLEWSDPEPVTGDDHVDWNVSMAMAPDGRPVISWTKYDPATGETSSSSGLRDGANIGRPAPGTADFTGTFQDAAVDEDNDQLYDHVAFSADVTVHSAGTYQLSADLIGPWKLATVSSSPLELDPGDHSIVIRIPGGIFSDVGYDGIYQLKNISLLDMTDTPMMTAFTSTPHETGSYTASEFVPGPLTLDKTVYQGLTDTAQVTLKAPEANLDPSAKDTVPVKVASTLNPKGMVVLLTETGPDTALFTGVFGFNLITNDPTSATVHVSDHSSVQVFHHDKSLDYHWMASARWITTAVTGDLDADGIAGLSDANTALQILTRQPAEVSPEYLNSELSPSGNPAVSLEDIPYILQKQSDLRP